MKRDKNQHAKPGQPASRGRLLTLDRTTLRRLEDSDLGRAVGGNQDVTCGPGCSD